MVSGEKSMKQKLHYIAFAFLAVYFAASFFLGRLFVHKRHQEADV
jgi:uncharacterized membrane protein